MKIGSRDMSSRPTGPLAPRCRLCHNQQMSGSATFRAGTCLVPEAISAVAGIQKRIQQGAVFVDLDDTLLDYQRENRRALHNLAQAIGVPPGNLLDTYVEAGQTAPGEKPRQPDRVLHAMAACAPLLSAESRSAYRDFYYRQRLAHVRPLDGAHLLLRQLRQCSPRVVLATHGLDIIQRQRLRRAGLADYFDDIIVSESRGVTKDDWSRFLPKSYLPLAARSAVISDSPYPDLDRARHLGMATVLVDTCGRLRAGDRFDLVVTGPRQLARLLAASGKDGGGRRC